MIELQGRMRVLQAQVAQQAGWGPHPPQMGPGGLPPGPGMHPSGPHGQPMQVRSIRIF